MSATVLMSESLSSEGSTDNGYLRIKPGAFMKTKLKRRWFISRSRPRTFA